MRERVLFITMAICALLGWPQNEAISVDIDYNLVVHTVSPMFSSYTLDFSQFVHNQSLMLNVLSNPAIISATKSLSPAYLRIGGTTADQVYLPTIVLDALHQFCTATNFQLVYALNNGPNSQNINETIQLLQYISDKNLTSFSAFEFGNEPNLYLFVFDIYVSPSELAQQFAAIIKIISDIIPWKFKIIGPDVAFQIPFVGELFPYYFEEVLLELQHLRINLDAVTWHYYPLQSERCPLNWIDPYKATVGNLLDREILVEFQRKQAEIARQAQKKYQQSSELWLGEASSISCGGQDPLSNSFADCFYYLAAMGGAAKTGSSVFARQTLLGETGNEFHSTNSYGIIVAGNATLYPDYFIAKYWRKYMGIQVFKAECKADGILVFAQGNSVAWMNLGDTPVNLDFQKTVNSSAIILATDGNIISRTVQIHETIIGAKTITAGPKQIGFLNFLPQ